MTQTLTPLSVLTKQIRHLSLMRTLYYGLLPPSPGDMLECGVEALGRQRREVIAFRAALES